MLFFFAFDIVFNFFTPFFDDNEELIIGFKEISFHYILGWFFLDILATAPLEFFIPDT